MPSVISRIQDIMAAEGAGARRVDLASVFAGAGLTYAVENSDGAVVSGAQTMVFTPEAGPARARVFRAL